MTRELVDETLLRIMTELPKTGQKALDDFTDDAMMAMSGMVKAMLSLEDLEPQLVPAFRLMCKGWKDLVTNALDRIIEEEMGE
jgi:hypothetical protein